MEKLSSRLISLDVFRGLTIAGMILVNNAGSWDYVYPALSHAEWHGVTPTDLIFPFFLFIMGVAIPFAFSKRIVTGTDKRKLLPKIVSRTAILILLGLIINIFPAYDWNFLERIRIPGILQRIAIAYFSISLLYLYTNIKIQAIIAFLILILYWAAMTLIPVPGVGYSNLEPATNLSAWIDRMVFSDHVWEYTKYWDPEGLLSTLPAISSGLFGLLTGWWIRSNRGSDVKTIHMFLFGCISIVVSLFWDMLFPLNKNLWTSSYVLYTTGMALLFFACCYWIIDVKGYTWWIKPFIVFGSNAITVFFLSEIIAGIFYMINVPVRGVKVELKEYIYQTFFYSWLSPIDASLAYALVYVLFWLGIMRILYAKKIFIKI